MIFEKIAPFIESVIPEHVIIPAAGIIAGYVLATKSFLINHNIGIAIVSFALMAGAYNTFNAYFDREIDEVNKPERPLPSGRMSPAVCLLYSVILYAFSLYLASFISTIFLVIVFLDLLVTVSYSMPPIRLKERTFLTNLSVGIHYGLFPFLAGWILFQPVSSAPWILVTLITLLAVGAVSIKDFEDYRGDRIFRIHTFPVLYGLKKSAKISSSLLILPFLLFLLLIFSGLLSTKYLL
ncbi:MAG: UbiA family prenyltransferase, partial [Candidatus Hodarchaeales archaeon]